MKKKEKQKNVSGSSRSGIYLLAGFIAGVYLEKSIKISSALEDPKTYDFLKDARKQKPHKIRSKT